MNEIKKYLLFSQLSLNGLLAICCLIIQSVVIHNGGVSNFGNHESTVALYTLGFILCAFFLSIAGWKLLKMKPKSTRPAYLLFVLSLLDVLVLISTFPRHISYTYSDIHDDLGIVLFVYYLFLSIWFVLRLKSYTTTSIFIAEIIGSIIGLLSITKVIHFLFIGQFIGGLAFGILLIICFPTSA